MKKPAALPLFVKAIGYIAVTGKAFKDWATTWVICYAFVLTFFMSVAVPAMFKDPQLIARFNASYAQDWAGGVAAMGGLLMTCALIALIVPLPGLVLTILADLIQRTGKPAVTELPEVQPGASPH